MRGLPKSEERHTSISTLQPPPFAEGDDFDLDIFLEAPAASGSGGVMTTEAALQSSAPAAKTQST